MIKSRDRAPSIGLLVMVMVMAQSACTVSAGPTVGAYLVKLPTGEQAYRITCYGLFESGETCKKKVEEICRDKMVRWLDPTISSVKVYPRERTFMCETPSGPVAVVVEPPHVEAKSEASRKAVLQVSTAFSWNSAALSAAGRGELRRLIADGEGRTYDVVIITGHTDSTGRSSYNETLSERRAQTVARYLQDCGLKAKRYQISGRGQMDPVASNKAEAGRARNRRVEIILK